MGKPACPYCGTTLRERVGPGGVSLVCGQCEGRAATVAYLRRRLPREIVNSLWQAAWSQTRKEGRACPSCGLPMTLIPVEDGSHGFHLDVCRTCQTVWFDPHEYGAMGPRETVPAEQSAALPRNASTEARERLFSLESRRIREQAYARHDEDSRPEAGWKWVAALLGLPVEVDEEPRGATPWVTWSVALAVLGVSVYAFTDLRHFVAAYGLVPTEWRRMGGLTFFTSFLLHGGISHLLGNLYFLVVFGDNVEDAIGHTKLFLLLLLTTLAGGAAHVAVDPASTVPCIGASGGISGVVAYYALRFPHMRLAFMWRILLFFRWFAMPAYAWFLLWVLLQTFGVWAQLQSFSNVSALAHVGGAAVGFAFWCCGEKQSSARW